MCPYFGRGCRRYIAHITAVGSNFETTARITAPRFAGRWYRRCPSYFTAVGAAFATTATGNAARLSDVGVGIMLPLLPLLGLLLTPRLG